MKNIEKHYQKNILYDDEKVYCKIRRITWEYKAIEYALERYADFRVAFCTCDSISYGAICALAKHNLIISGAVSIIGFDNLDTFSDFLELSTMNIPKYKMGLGTHLYFSVSVIARCSHIGNTLLPFKSHTNLDTLI